MILEDLIKRFPLDSAEKRICINGNEVPESFKTIAQSILSGHFEIKEGHEVVRKVYPTCVEIYYHEESNDEDAIKDYIVYHRKKDHKNPGLFRSGSLNTHQSGIDITFEHKICENTVRASALIRKYIMVDNRYENESPLTIENNKVDDRSTYLYEALFADLSIIKGFSIQWVDGEGAKEMTEPTYRKNVLLYNKDTHQKDKNSKHDGRCWQFSVKKHNNG